MLLWSFAASARAFFLVYTENDPAYVETLRLVELGLAVGAAIAAAGLLVGAVEGVVSRRRVLAGLSAAGTPRAVLDRAVLAEVMLPIALPVVLAAVAGTLGGRAVLGGAATRIVTSTEADGNVIATATPFAVAVPWGTLVLLVLGTLLAILATTAAALPLLRRSIDPSELRTA